MGWRLKALAFLFGLFAVSFGAILVAIPVFLYVFWPWIRGERRKGGPAGAKGPKVGGGWMKYVGFFFLFLSALAFVGGGSISPLVFGGLGVVLLFYGRGSSGSMPSWIAPVKDSIVLRDRILPFRWFAVAEIKALSLDAPKVLPAVNERLLVKTGGNARAYAVLEISALSEGEAEVKLVTRLREVARVILPLGAYLLPLKSEESFALVKCSRQSVKLDMGNLEHSMASAPYDLIVIKPQGHMVESLGAYQLTEGGNSELATKSPQGLNKSVLVWEVVTTVSTRARWVPPDEETAFISSLAATRGAQIGERLVDAGSESGGQTLVVRSLNTVPVELSRGQVRALVRIYS